MDTQTIIVACIVIISAALLIKRFFFAKKGCSSCDHCDSTKDIEK